MKFLTIVSRFSACSVPEIACLHSSPSPKMDGCTQALLENNLYDSHFVLTQRYPCNGNMIIPVIITQEIFCVGLSVPCLEK